MVSGRGVGHRGFANVLAMRCAPQNPPVSVLIKGFCDGFGALGVAKPAGPRSLARFSGSCLFLAFSLCVLAYVPLRGFLRSAAFLSFFGFPPMSAGLRSAARLLVPARSCLFWLSPLCAYVPLPGSYVPLPVSSWPSSYVCWPTFRCPGVYVPLRSCLLLWLAYVREGVTLETSRELRDISAVWAASCQTG